MESIIDEEKNIKHSQIADDVEQALFDKESRRKMKLPANVDPELMDCCYSPIVQSGGEYDLKPSAMSNDEVLHFGTIICCLGARYRSYCANIGRTFLVESTKDQEVNYRFLMELHQMLARSLKDGSRCSDVYLKALHYIQKKRPELEPHFVKNVGFGMGLEFRESLYVLSAKNDRELQSGMIVSLITGFQDLPNPGSIDSKLQKYSLLLADTVEIRRDEGVFLTESGRKFDDIAYFLKGEEEAAEEDEKVDRESAVSISRDFPKKDAIITRKAIAQLAAGKGNQMEEDGLSAEQRRREHQKELQRQRQLEGEQRYTGPLVHQAQRDASQVARKFESYKSISDIPKEAKRSKIFIDKQHETVLFPIHGMLVPLHLSTIKNVSLSDEGEFVYLRVNFMTPGQLFGKKESLPFFVDPNSTFIRELTYRSPDSRNLNEAFRMIRDLKKRLTEKETEKREKEDLVVQDDLIVIKGKPIPRLPDVTIRPSLQGRKLSGTLEAHTNGLRYTTFRGDKVDLLYNNIKHFFFQPCEHELIVVLHCHLKHPIFIGKRKTDDVQFIREVMEISFDETTSKRKTSLLDRDELEAEQEERRRRKALNKEFKSFAEKTMELSDNQIDVDVPFRDLGFPGVTHRTTVLLQPTTDCLVQLVEPPFTVIPLAEVELAHFERVQFGLKNFDIVFVLKEYARPVVQINSVPMAQLDNIKDWLDSVDIPYSEGPANLNWTAIMKHVNEDPAAFFAEGGWSFLQSESEDEAANSEEEVQESGSEYEPSEDDEEYEEGEDEDYESEEERESDIETPDEYEDEEEEEGKDWDELEKEAIEHDRKFSNPADADRPEKRSRTAAHSGDSDDRTKKSKSRR